MIQRGRDILGTRDGVVQLCQSEVKNLIRVQVTGHDFERNIASIHQVPTEPDCTETTMAKFVNDPIAI
jgi:hypothetical protein